SQEYALKKQVSTNPSSSIVVVDDRTVWIDELADVTIYDKASHTCTLCEIAHFRWLTSSDVKMGNHIRRLELGKSVPAMTAVRARRTGREGQDGPSTVWIATDTSITVWNSAVLVRSLMLVYCESQAMTFF